MTLLPTTAFLALTWLFTLVAYVRIMLKPAPSER